MIELTGQYTSCKIFNGMVDNTSIQQVYQFLNHPAFENKKTRFMPDIHAGSGAVIGTTVELGDKVIPNVIGVDIGCLDAETEFLTSKGWKKISAYSVGDDVLQYDKETDKANFCFPLNYINKPCDIFYYFKNSKGLDQMISEEHKMLIWKGFKSRGYKIEDFSPVDLCSRSIKNGFYNIKTTFIIDQLPLPISDDMIRLDVMISADGCMKYCREQEHQIYLHLKKERKIKRALLLLHKNNIKYEKSIGKDGTTNIYFFVNKRFNKDLSKYFHASYDQLKIIAEESLLWDGHKGYRSFFSSTNKQNADVIQFAFTAINIRAGISISIAETDNHADYYIVTPTKNNIIGMTEYKVIKSFNARKYCFTVPTGYFVIRRNGKISITGNCGMLSVNIGKTEINLEEFDIAVNNLIPSGFSVNSTIVPGLPQEFVDNVIAVCNKLEIDSNRVLKGIGTLGGGNHFIELGVDENSDKWITIHSGSRNFGLQIAKYHQKIAENETLLMSPNDFQEKVEEIKRTKKGKEISKAIEKLRKDSKVRKHKRTGMEYLTGESAKQYFEDMKLAQYYATLNHNEIIIKILSYLNINIRNKGIFLESVRSVHNYIDFDSKIIRKGAISAQKGEKVVISWNMRDGLIIGVGKGNPDWNFSAPHGAGRVLSRSKAKEQISLEDFQESMEGIYSTSVCSSTIDESPFAYKDAEEIEKYIEPTVEILHRVKPIYNFKAK
jgi:RNA-splicing ligase RtcB